MRMLICVYTGTRRARDARAARQYDDFEFGGAWSFAGPRTETGSARFPERGLDRSTLVRGGRRLHGPDLPVHRLQRACFDLWRGSRRALRRRPVAPHQQRRILDRAAAAIARTGARPFRTVPALRPLAALEGRP